MELSLSYSRQRLNRQITANFHKKSAKSQAFRMVKLKHPTCDFTNLAERIDARLVHAEMLRPTVGAWIEETNQRSGAETQGAQIGAFVPIAVKAGIG